MSPASGDLGNLSMFDLFRLEVEAQVASISDVLLSLGEGVSSESQLEILMRASHSLKGAARMVSVEPIVKITHVMEDVFVAAQKGEVALVADDVDVLLSAIDKVVLVSNIPEKEIGEWENNNKELVSSLVEALMMILSSENPHSSGAGEDVESLQLSDNVSAPVIAEDNMHNPDHRALKVSADRMSKILGHSSEMLVEARG